MEKITLFTKRIKKENYIIVLNKPSPKTASDIVTQFYIIGGSRIHYTDTAQRGS